MVRNMVFKPDIMLMVPMMIETIYKRLSVLDPQILKAVLAEKVFGGKLQTIFTGGAQDLDPYYIDRFAEYGVQILKDMACQNVLLLSVIIHRKIISRVLLKQFT